MLAYLGQYVFQLSAKHGGQSGGDECSIFRRGVKCICRYFDGALGGKKLAFTSEQAR
jgi:hypothetical protein